MEGKDHIDEISVEDVIISRGLESLEVWQRARKLAVHICKEILTALAPLEKSGLVEQLRRSTQSIPANIAEGFGRYYYPESVRFCYMARDSLEGTYSHLCLAQDLGYISKESFEYVNSELKMLRRMLSGYIVFLKRNKRGGDEPGTNQVIKEPLRQYSVDLGVDSSVSIVY